MHADPSAVPDQKTLALVNTYIVGVVRMLNDFSCACEQSLSTVHTNLQAAEARLALLEAQVATAVPGAAATALVDSDSRQSAAVSQGDVCTEVDAAAVDHGGDLAPRRCNDWATGAGEQPAFVASAADDVNDAADVPTSRP